ncbi:MAG TPA: sigma-54 dependent transcriptional regulator [Terriglobia bacterium]|nr:sigma-54 dependent transcriptional regulator [Terriglobia bacterium]
MTNQDAVNILVVDDDRATQDLLREVLEDEGFRVVTSASGEEALAIGERECFDVIISDMKLGPNLTGLDVLRAYKSIQPESEVILITAFGSMETAIEAVKAGAFDYISKPFKLDEVVLQVGRALENRNLIAENRSLKRQLGSQVQLSSIVGRSPAMLEVYKKIAMVSDSRSTVLLYGESGTGKELVAKAVHHNGPRAAQRFFAVNCGALPETLLESELFGHMRGSFTGAVENKRGIFEEASGGTVFLDEVSEMSPALQVKLLRALEEQEVRRVGSNATVKFDVRFIAATNRRLGDLVEEKKFREDLYYRLRVVEIDLPPLRERAEDIPLLVEHFLKRFGSERGQTFTVSPPALSALVVYPWPGNVRELENALEAAVAMNRSGVILPENLPPKLRSEAPRNGARVENLCSDLPSIEEMKRRYAAYVLRLSGSNKAKAAGILGIDRKTLYALTEKYKAPM